MGKGVFDTVFVKNRVRRHWGRGSCFIETDGGTYKYKVDGGIYMASSVSNTCAIWTCKIIKDKDGRDVIGHLGDLQHLRNNLEALDVKPILCKSNKLYWITDRTPHEVLPMNQSGYRQFFRLVTNDVGIWYEQHSTMNPNGVLPDPKVTRIVKGNKFDLQYDKYDDNDL